ncbi:hypothetical protein VCHA50O413_20372 [Vibrio chagasii]|nr:hypothetical protein VCHA34P114_220008 [Vibrio chagasii]CAH7006281.1 hypothetical protein VCHA50O405_10368 [Vibrio chagasii]CAH7094564.1 hypothetical protein VCHA50O402_20372 [Vibrio chagasii]CAH7145947.1 hypothetical protein VCHA50O413_20372 [Vibrio chagasii]CAH7153441.1 hypothetical protein VCHA50O387_210010 [Vibrio chagasii]
MNFSFMNLDIKICETYQSNNDLKKSYQRRGFRALNKDYGNRGKIRELVSRTFSMNMYGTSTALHNTYRTPHRNYIVLLGG